MKESTITNAIMKRLRSLGFYVLKIHGGPYQQVGVPDLLAVKDGHAFFFEVKQPGKSPTLRQEEEMRRLKDAGAVVGVVTSVDEALDLLPRPLTPTPRQR